MTEGRSGAVKAMSDAVLAIAGERSVDTVLQRIVHTARELVGARYAALGVPDGEGNFARFITSGMTEEEVEAMGPLPRTHGLLGATLESEESYRTLDIKRDPRFRGWWPSAHPLMGSFLGVPIVARGEVVGAFYLTDKERAEEFDAEDQELIEMLAPHAAVAMENARLYERSRELSIVEERNRLARELHDSLVQKLFGVVLAAQSAGTLLERDSEAAREQVGGAAGAGPGGGGGAALAGVPAAPRGARDRGPGGRAAQARRAAAASAPGGDRLRARAGRRACGRGWTRRSSGSPRSRCRTRCAMPAPSTSSCASTRSAGGLRLTVADDGVGFEPEEAGLRSRRLGLTSMEERARALGGSAAIESAPGPRDHDPLEVDCAGFAS